ncbi:MAG: 3-deoxy-manno-octulosonate cytidylyltransferase [Rhodospirillales bacterium]
MTKICVIPARMASTRFPGKPLAPLLGTPMIVHVLERARLCPDLDRVVVATCDPEIAKAIEAVGGEAVMTADTHERCTDRTEEAIRNLGLSLADNDLVLMLQGDEIMVSPEMLSDMVIRFESTGADVINLISRLYTSDDHADPNTVKAVSAPDGRILYMSRAAIPSTARADDVPVYQQTGIISFKATFLKHYSELPQTPLEKIESCDMLRVIEHGLPIYGVPTETETIGVDTEADRARAEQRLAEDPTTSRYMDIPTGIKQ